MAQWCVVIIRGLPCTQVGLDDSEAEVTVDDVVTVYGPFSRETADKRAKHFNTEKVASEPTYEPVPYAPIFIKQKKWDEHWAIVRPMNDVQW